MRRYLDRTQRTGRHRCGARRNPPLPAHVVPWRGPNKTEASGPSFTPRGWGKEPDVSTSEISTSGGLGCEAAATRSLAVASDASAVSLASGLRHDADVGLRRLPALRIELLGFLVRHGPGDDDVLARLPVHGRGDPMLGGELKRVDDAQHLVEVAARGHRIDQDELDLLIRPD